MADYYVLITNDGVTIAIGPKNQPSAKSLTNGLNYGRGHESLLASTCREEDLPPGVSVFPTIEEYLDQLS